MLPAHIPYLKSPRPSLASDVASKTELKVPKLGVPGQSSLSLSGDPRSSEPWVLMSLGDPLILILCRRTQSSGKTANGIVCDVTLSLGFSFSKL